MKTHGRIPNAAALPRTATVPRSPGAHRANSTARTAGGILILTLVAGGAGAAAAGSLGHNGAGQARGDQPVGSAHVATGAHATIVHNKPDRPWMP
jgi:hypothetical protein